MSTPRTCSSLQIELSYEYQLDDLDGSAFSASLREPNEVKRCPGRHAEAGATRGVLTNSSTSCAALKWMRGAQDEYRDRLDP